MLCCTVQRYLPGVFHLATVGFTAIKYIPDDENTPAEAWINDGDRRVRWAADDRF